MKEYQQMCVGSFIQRKDGSFLVVKRADDDDFLPGVWELPGGGTDFGEDPKEAIIRETKEETGLDIIVGKPVSIASHFMKKENEKIQRVEITFLCTLQESDTVKLSFEHSEYKWIMSSEIDTVQVTDYMKNIILDSIHNI